MSGETFSNISPALSQIYSAKLADARNMDCEELNLFPIVPTDSGKNVAWTAKFDGDRTHTNFSDSEDVAVGEYTKTAKVPASLGFGNYRAPVEVGDVAVVLAGNAEGSADQLTDLTNSELTDGVVQLCKGIAVDFWTGDGDVGGDPTIVGITGGAALATGTYATIERGTYPQWAGNVLANGGIPRPLTDDLLRQAEALIFAGSQQGGPADLILTTAGVHRKYAGLFGSALRVNTGGQMAPQLAMGTNELFWGGMPVRRSARAPSQTLLMCSRQNVQWVIPREFIRFASMGGNPMFAKMGMDLKRAFALPIAVKLLGATGNSTKFNPWTMIQLRVKNPNAVALIQDISES